MTQVPLGRGAYERLYAGSPRIELLNRWLEANPANLREGTAVLARPGTINVLPEFAFDQGEFSGLGAMRGVYALSGLFDDSLFVVCGSNLYKIAEDLTVTLISGVINGTGYPEVAWQKGVGYERLWISDGLLLQFYGGLSSSRGTLTASGGANASGTLTKTGTITNGTDKFEVGGVYYTWGTSFNTSDAGTSANPYIIKPTDTSALLDPMNQAVKAINATGISGTDYSGTLVKNTFVTALGDGGLPAAVVTMTAIAGGSGGAAIPFTVVGGTHLSISGSGTLQYAGIVNGTDKFEVGGIYYVWGSTFSSGDDGSTGTPFIVNPLNSSGAFDPMAQLILAVMSTGTPGTDYSGTITGPNTAASAVGDGMTPVKVVTFAALAPGTGGDATTFSVTAGSALTASGSGTLTGGGIDALQGCTMPGGVTPQSLTQVSSYVLVSQANSQEFFWVNPGEITIDPLNFASKESSPDPITCMRAVGDQVLIMGERSTENWYATGNLAAPFAPIEGRVYARGAIAGTPVVVDDSIYLVGDDGKVYGIGYTSGDPTESNWGVNRISNNGIEERVRYQLRREDGLTP